MSTAVDRTNAKLCDDYFYRVRKAYQRTTELDPGEKDVLQYLGDWRTGEVYPGIDRIAHETGIPGPTVRAIIKRLKVRGYLAVRANHRRKGAVHRSNDYTLTAKSRALLFGVEAGIESIDAHRSNQTMRRDQIDRCASIESIDYSDTDYSDTDYSDQIDSLSEPDERERVGAVVSAVEEIEHAATPSLDLERAPTPTHRPDRDPEMEPGREYAAATGWSEPTATEWSRLRQAAPGMPQDELRRVIQHARDTWPALAKKHSIKAPTFTVAWLASASWLQTIRQDLAECDAAADRKARDRAVAEARQRRADAERAAEVQRAIDRYAALGVDMTAAEVRLDRLDEQIIRAARIRRYVPGLPERIDFGALKTAGEVYDRDIIPAQAAEIHRAAVALVPGGRGSDLARHDEPHALEEYLRRLTASSDYATLRAWYLGRLAYLIDTGYHLGSRGLVGSVREVFPSRESEYQVWREARDVTAAAAE